MGLLGAKYTLHSVRSRILFYSLMMIIPLALLTVYLAFDERREQEARALFEERFTVRLVTTDLNRVFEFNQRLISGLTLLRDEEKICDSIKANRQPFPEFFNLGLLEMGDSSSRARLLCAAAMPTNNNVPFVPTPDELRILSELTRIGEVAVAPVRLSLIEGRSIIPIAGFAGNGSHGERRFVAATLNLDWLSKVVLEIPIPAGAALLVLDKYGTIAARNPVSAEWVVGKPAPEFERALPARKDFAGEIIGEGGVSRYYALLHIPSADGMAVVMKRRSGQLFWPSRLHLITNLLGLLVIGGVVFLTAWWNARRYLVGPLTKLGIAANRLSAGDLAVRSELSYEGDIGKVAQSFDVMAAAIQRQEATNQELIDSLRALTDRMASASEEERLRIAREIHDGLGQELTGIKFDLFRLRKSVEKVLAPEACQLINNQIEDVCVAVDESIRDLRRIATELRPAVVSESGLTEAIRWLGTNFQKQTGVACRVTIVGNIQDSGDLATNLFRICQESLTNVARHAAAESVDVKLEANLDSVELTVTDDGRGFDLSEKRKGGSLGLLGMRERVRAAGGRIDVKSTPGNGTTVEVRVPLHPQDAAATV